MDRDTLKIGKKKELEAWKSWGLISAVGWIMEDTVEFKSSKLWFVG